MQLCTIGNHDQNNIIIALSIVTLEACKLCNNSIPAGPAPIIQYWVVWLLAKAAQTAPRESKVVRNIELLAISPKQKVQEQFYHVTVNLC